MIELPTLIEKLEKLPSLIARQSYIVEDAHKNYKQKEAEYDNYFARRLLELKATNDKFTVTETKYLTQRDTGVYGKRLEVIEAEAKYRAEEVRRQELDDQYTAYKVIARVKMAELRTTDDGWQK